MNLSIFNSDYLKKIYALFGSAIFLYFFYSFCFYIFETQQDAFYESYKLYEDKHISEKNKLMKNIYKSQHPDIIFIGNSTTRNQVSTHQFKMRHINIFNYGLDGHSFSHYFSMIENSIKIKPKIIVFSLSRRELYLPIAYFYKNYTHEDINLKDMLFLSKYANTPDMRDYLIDIYKDYILNISYFSNRGFKISNFLTKLYTGTYKPRNIDIYFGFECKYDKYQIVSKENCNNGDGILFNHIPTLSFTDYNQPVNYPKENINPQLISILNDLFERIRSNGITPILVFIPDFFGQKTDLAYLYHQLNVQIIDFSDLKFPKDNWYDCAHLNEKGRQIYSEKLADSLSRYLS